MTISVKLITAKSGLASHPSVEVGVPEGFKIIGGGAFTGWRGAGNLLTASFPKNGGKSWFAAGKDHEVASPATITAFALAIEDPRDEWDVIIKSASSDPAPNPQAVANLPEGYLLTGGGAFVNWRGEGNLLTASFPNSDISWEARSKDHDISDPSKITAFAIGIRNRAETARLERLVVKSQGRFEAQPNAQACLNSSEGWTLSGGGAIDNWSGAGNLLTASFPRPRDLYWIAEGKDHLHSSPASITAFAIFIR